MSDANLCGMSYRQRWFFAYAVKTFFEVMASAGSSASHRWPGLLMLKRALVCFFAAVVLLLLSPSLAQAQVLTNESDESSLFVRSFETLRDLEYHSWQVVAYRQGPPGEPVVLRIVGYPGKVRLTHPTALLVHAGRRDWALDDITMASPQLAKDGREAAAEFDLDPLLDDLTNNRPLRLQLAGVFTELPVPPYVVGEWRSLPQASQ